MTRKRGKKPAQLAPGGKTLPGRSKRQGRGSAKRRSPAKGTPGESSADGSTPAARGPRRRRGPRTKRRRSAFAGPTNPNQRGVEARKPANVQVKTTNGAQGETLREPKRSAPKMPTGDDDSALGIGSRVVPPAMDFDEESADELFDEQADASLDSDVALGPDVQEQIRQLEARLDGMIRQAHLPDAPPGEFEGDGSTGSVVSGDAATTTESTAKEPGSDARLRQDHAELLRSEFFAQQWGRAGLRRRVEEVDEFGLDRVLENKLRPVSELLYKRYFRTETHGIENIPADGRCVIVANHSGSFPIDGAMLRTAVRLSHPSSRDLRWLAEDFIFYLPFIGTLLNRIGAVRACQENAERLLNKESLLAVFPEGLKGIRKLYKERYRLQRFGRGGYIRLCLRTGAPLVPCAIVGAEESYPLLYRVDAWPGWFGLPYLPVTPTFPWLGPLGLLPAPAKWRISFGEPLRLDTYGPEAENDHGLVGSISEQVRSSIVEMLERTLKERPSPWLG